LRRTPLGIVFTDPQIAIVGRGFTHLQTHALAAGEVSFEDQGRARVMLRNRGHLRVYGDPETGRFLGAEMVGPDAEHIGHLLAWALQSKLTVAQMLEMPFYHPVVAEGLRTALRELASNIRQTRDGVELHLPKLGTESHFRAEEHKSSISEAGALNLHAETSSLLPAGNPRPRRTART
jgi:hypothetical protein